MRYLSQTALLSLAAASIMGCGAEEEAASNGENEQVVFIDRESLELTVAPLQSVPAVNPKTGKPTLTRGLYCGECKTWRPMPVAGMYAGNPLTMPCPKHGGPMSPTGPLPGQDGPPTESTN